MNFSGQDEPDMASWLEFQTAMAQIKEIHNFNKADAVVRFLTKIHEPARLLILSKATQRSVKDIFKKLKSVYGTPQKFYQKLFKITTELVPFLKQVMGKYFKHFPSTRASWTKLIPYFIHFKKKIP